LWNICRSPTRCSPYSLLFIIYINDIADKLVSLSRLFADDTSFGYSNQDTMQCHLILTKQTSWFSLIVAFQKILISLLMENQCPLGNDHLTWRGDGGMVSSKKIFWFPMLLKKIFWFWWRKKIIIWFRVFVI
jgi:hypothetical protein